MIVAVLLAGAATAAETTDGKRTEVAPGLHVGDILGKDNAEKAKDLLPPEIVKHYANGDYRNVIVEYPLGNQHWEKAWNEATEKNATQLDVNAVGAIVYKGSGKQPEYVYGMPFPTIDPNDPKAATKIVWNQFLAYWNNGSTFNHTLVVMLNPKGIDRTIGAKGWFKFYDGQGEKYREPNPLNLQSQFLGVSTTPADLQGTASLTWRYRDAAKRDSVWAFVPALRRVRQVSPANRSDGYLGSDISGDDGFFFDGKPEDFEWKLIGRRDALRIVDPRSVSGQLKIPAAEGGGWTTLIDDHPPVAGYDDPKWTGLPWASVQGALAKRPMWVIQATPKDKYYLYGKIELWIDAETWDGAWNRKFNWQGELVHGYSLMARVNHMAGSPEHPEWLSANTQVWACAENYKMNRATLSGMRAYAGAPFIARAPVPASIFESQSLLRYGK